MTEQQVTEVLEQIDRLLIELCWSLWSELGVAGTHRRHQNSLISLEELIILTSSIAELDPRLRDEALDWCSKYHHFVSTSRLRTLVSALGNSVHIPFSAFAETLNSISQAKWPIFSDTKPLKVYLSGKSTLSSLEAPALLSLRLRAIFGIGIRADLLTYCLIQENNSFTAADATTIGYNKRSLAEVLDHFTQSGLITRLVVGNRYEYALAKREELQHMLGALPEVAPDWYNIVKVFIQLRSLLHQHEKISKNSLFVVVVNELEKLKNSLKQIHLLPPQKNISPEIYCEMFFRWFLNILREAAQGSFWEGFNVKNIEIINRQTGFLIQYVYEVQDCVDGLEHIINYAKRKPSKHEDVFKKNHEYMLTFLSDLVKSTEKLLTDSAHLLPDIKLLEILLVFEREKLPTLKAKIEEIYLNKEISSTTDALKQYADLETILNVFHSFIYTFTEQLKKTYLFHTDIHLLTSSARLYKRHLIISLFS